VKYEPRTYELLVKRFEVSTDPSLGWILKRRSAVHRRARLDVTAV
jgi:hypothetical protein